MIDTVISRSDFLSLLSEVTQLFMPPHLVEMVANEVDEMGDELLPDGDRTVTEWVQTYKHVYARSVVG